MNKNVFQMYVENDNRAEFWIRRQSWGGTVAKVLTVQGQRDGELEGSPPYYGNPIVRVGVYDLSGKLIDGRAELRGPGNYSYERIPAPFNR